MKTKLITLEAHDTLISVRDKLTWAKTARILLVWPGYEQVALRTLDLKVLQRHASALGAQLGLVTRSDKVRRDALALGIPLFESSKEAQKASWPVQPATKNDRMPSAHVPRRELHRLKAGAKPVEAKWRSLSIIRILSFTAAVVAVLLLAALFIPNATVTIYPETQIQEARIPVVASPATAAVSLTGFIPAHELILEISGERSIETHGRIAIPLEKSSGKVRFTNLTQAELEIPEGTIVSTSANPPVKFKTTHATLLPAGLNAIVEVPIDAISPGAQANVGAGEIREVEGLLGLSVSIDNPEPTVGGSDDESAGATEAERINLRVSLLDALTAEAISQMRLQIEPQDWLLEETVALRSIITEAYDPPPGQPGKTLNLSMQVEFTAYYLQMRELNEMAKSTLDLGLPEGFVSTEDPVLTAASDFNTDQDGTTRFDLRITRLLRKTVDQLEISEMVRGRRIAEAIDYLDQKITGRQPSDIRLNPDWWPWTPLIPFNITVEAR